MNVGHVLIGKNQESVLAWAAQKRILLSASLLPGGHWHNLRSQLLRFDAGESLLQIAYPIATDHHAPPEIVSGQQLGLSFRRGHKKCIFVTSVVMRRAETGDDGISTDTLIVRVPSQIREMQRRLYQRITLPATRFIAAKLWEGGLPQEGQTPWPLCAGRVSNISAGGILVDIRVDQNPKLAVGDNVGVELTVRAGQPALTAEAQYRHCVLATPDRLGLGLQFVGLEQDTPGRTTLVEIAELVRSLRREGAVSSTDESSDQ